MRPDLEHKQQGPHAVRCFVLTISDTRTEATDTSGAFIADALTHAGHTVADRAILPDDGDAVRALVSRQLERADVDLIITTGGTGITSRDATFEAIDGILEKRLSGFGELFRMLSYHDIGAAAMMSRATAGIARRHIVIVLPGSLNAVRLAMDKLVIPELGHLVQQARK